MDKTLSLRFIFILFLLLISSIAVPQTKEQQIAFADSIYDSGNYEQSIILFTNLLEKFGDDEVFYRSRGKSFINIGQFQNGIDDYKKALHLNPACARCYLNLGMAKANLGDFDSAITYLDSAIMLNDTLLDAYMLKVEIFEAQQDFLDAELLFRSINSKFALDPYYYLSRGTYYHNQKLNSKAAADFDKAVSLRPFDTDILFERVKFLVDAGEWEKALADLNKCLYKDSLSSIYLGTRGSVYFAIGEKEKALLDYNKALLINPFDFVSQVNRADLYYKLENMDAACEDVTRAKEIIISYPEYAATYSEWLNATYEDICNSNNPSYYYQRGIAQYNLVDYKKAVEFYDIGLEIFPQHAIMHSFKGNALLELEKFEEAIVEYQLSNKFSDHIEDEISHSVRSTLTPEMFEVYIGSFVVTNNYSMGEAYANLGKYDEALTKLKYAVDNSSKIPAEQQSAFHNMYGAVLMETGDYKNALINFDKAIAFNKLHLYAYVNKALCIYSELNENGKRMSTLYLSVNSASAASVTIPKPKFSADKKDELSKAIDFCNQALAIDKQFAYAYLVKAMIKKSLDQPDFCLDLESAKLYGYQNAFEMVGGDCE